MTAGTITGALLQLVVLGMVGWHLGNRALDRITGDSTVRPVGPPERALAAVTGAVMFSIGLMVAHIVLGGAVFGSPAPVPIVAVGVVAVTRKRRGVWNEVPWRRVAIAAAVLGAIYLAPAVIGGSSLRTGDPPWHLGWSEQLLAGEPVPTGPAPGFGRNAYPWGLHAVMATAVRLVPGTSPIVSLEMLHIALIGAIPLAAACLARRVRPDAGWTAAGAASLIGGFGWIAAGGPDFVASPSNARYGADLVAASPNSVYELFPPALPRELGLVMLGVAAWLIWASVRSRSRGLWLAAGVSLGLVGLISVPLFVTALLWLIASVIAVPREARARWLAAVGGAGLLAFLLWAGPVLSDVIRHGGFVNITPQLGYEWSLPVALAGWGLLLPLAIAGVIFAIKAEARLPIAFAITSSLLLLAAVARGYFDWDLAGNATLFHQGRVWPPLHMLGAVFAGVALVRIAELLRTRRKWLGATAITAVFVVGAASPVLAAIELTDMIERDTAGFEYARDDMETGSFVHRVATYLGPDEVLEVKGDDNLAFLLFQLSGVRLTNYDDPRLDGNEVRIRYADLAAAHDARAAEEGFDPTYMILPAPEGPYRRVLERGTYANETWALIQLSP